MKEGADAPRGDLQSGFGFRVLGAGKKRPARLGRLGARDSLQGAACATVACGCVFGRCSAEKWAMASRKSRLLNRLRQKLQKKKASFADEFEYKMIILVNGTDPQTPPLVYQAEKVALWMTNQGEKDMMSGVSSKGYKSQDVKDLMNRDTVQIHAMRWMLLNGSKSGQVKNMNLCVWPNPANAIESIEALCFTRWKRNKAKEPFKLLNHRFLLHYHDVQRHVSRCVLDGDRRGISPKKREIVFNSDLNLAIWISKDTRTTVQARLTSVMLCIPQAELTRWCPNAHLDEARFSTEKLSWYHMILWREAAKQAREKRHELPNAVERKSYRQPYSTRLQPFFIEGFPKMLMKSKTSFPHTVGGLRPAPPSQESLLKQLDTA